jgi:integrase
MTTRIKATRTYQKLSDGYVSALWEFSRDDPAMQKTVWDSDVRGLRVRVGAHRLTWSFFREHRDHGTRKTTCKVLGHWPQMGTAAARKAALVKAGSIATGRIEPGMRAAVKFEAAFANYLDHLERKAAKAGKPARWRKNVDYLGKQLLLPRWGKWSLAEMSGRPDAVAAWHLDVTKENGPISANHCIRLIRAVYRRAARLDRTLPPGSPTSAVEMNSEAPHGRGLAFADFPKWADAWRAIENPVHRAYHLCGLLTGCRPGELAQLRWQDVRPRERALVISAAKANNDIHVPLSIPIVRALVMARRAGAEELVFPDCAQRGRHDKLPARGIELRRTYRTVAADCGVDEMLSHFLLGHAPAGISQRYVARMILASGPALRQAQRKISRRIVQLLNLTLP